MQKTFFIKKKCFLCQKISICSIETNIIKGGIKCCVYRCQNCSLEFLDRSFVNKNIFNNMYHGDYKYIYDKKFKDNQNNIYKKIYEKTKYFLKNKDVLEIGPGEACFYHYLKKNVKNYTAFELSSKHRKYLEEKFNIKSFGSISKIKKKYDVLILISVLEHIKNPINFLKKISTLLKPNGNILIEVPNVNDPLLKLYGLKIYKENYYRKAHINYFNSKTLRIFLKKLNFKILYQKNLISYSLTNHLSWLFKKKGNKNSIEATNIYLANYKRNHKLLSIFSKMDTSYKKLLEYKGYGDIEICVCKNTKNKSTLI